MEEEILKIKYAFLKSQLYSIKEKLENLEENMDNLQAFMNNTLVIDKKIIDEEQFLKNKKIVSEIKQEIILELIPMINGKI